ncbi:hypothetical protein JTB14_012085 [Gonioctena quinquepunctata]|nr:hypothetical protein JTB14_012085 [Gonioctena quinquepunctata]
MGVTGQILDFATRKPIERANLTIVGKDMKFWSSYKTGEFWRILLPGQYQLKVEADGYYPQIEPFTVPKKNSEYPVLTSLTVFLYNSTVYSTTTTQKTTTTEKTTTKDLGKDYQKLLTDPERYPGPDCTPPSLPKLPE